ncbi:MAG TPA: glycosyltransferase family 1 protein [Solirubrobacteraceae bacterium]|nr:glycosyltransferase family 1 protein [Solirubrobacteraceae bacterium]
MAGTRALTIGIDARAALEEPAGQGRVVRELLRVLGREASGHRYRCYARERWEDAGDRLQWRLLELPDPWWHVRVAALAARECDVLLSPSSYVTVCAARGPAVPIVHDLATFDRSLEPNRRSMVIERLTLGLAVRRAAALIAVSEATAADLGERFPRAAGKLSVARLGVSPTLSAPSGGEQLDALPPPGFVLAVGTLEPRKNLARLAAAYGSLPAALQAAHPLVLAGRIGWRTGPALAALEALGDRAIRLGFVEDAALAELYRRCAVFCYPSLGEGFGLPVLEAMAAGAAVLTSPVSSLPEVAGDAARYAPPRDTVAIAGELRRLLEDEPARRELGERAVMRAATFSWSSFAERTVEVLERAASRAR